jgi:hypothetical protein
VCILFRFVLTEAKHEDPHTLFVILQRHQAPALVLSYNVEVIRVCCIQILRRVWRNVTFWILSFYPILYPRNGSRYLVVHVGIAAVGFGTMDEAAGLLPLDEGCLDVDFWCCFCFGVDCGGTTQRPRQANRDWIAALPKPSLQRVAW